MLQADRVQKILARKLEFYKPIISEAHYAQFEKTRKSTKKHMWYSERMPLKALIYILCENPLKSGEERLRMEMQEAAKLGRVWPIEKQKKKHAKMFKEATKEWRSDGQKLAPLLNPAYGSVVDKAAEMFSLTKRLSKEKAKDNSICNLDRARLFTGVTYLDADLRTVLLEASCTPSLQKQFYHPHSLDDGPIKQWLHTWHVWNSVESISCGLLNAIYEEIKSSHPAERFPGTKDPEIIEFFVAAFKDYADLVKANFFGTM